MISRIVFPFLLTFSLILPANAQMPPGYVSGGGQEPDGYYQDEGAPPPSRGSTGGNAAYLVRIERLEGQIRTLNGQVEELQYNLKKLEDKLVRSQQDVEERLQEKNGSRPGNTSNIAPSSGGSALPSSPVSSGVDRPKSRNDAFDPSLHPTAPGAPRDLTRGDNAAPPPIPTAKQDNPLGARQIGAALPVPSQGATQTAGIPEGPKAEFDVALVSFKNGQYTQAQAGFRNFVDKYPKDPQADDAVFYLGEAFDKTNQSREAAEQYLKYTNTYGKSARAPEALYRLGVALQKLGAKDQACSAFAEVGKRYPAASAGVKGNVATAQKKSGC